MSRSRSTLTALGAVLVFGAVSCAPQASRPLTEREKTAAIGGLAGGATGAIIGSMTGSALAGGLFGIPLGAVAGWYLGDQYDVALQRERDRDVEIERLRLENERLRRESEDIRRPSAEAPAASSSERIGGGQSDQIRQAQLALNKRGFDAGRQDGIWGPETESAVRNFQKSRGLEVTGRLDDRTIRELGIDERRGQPDAPSGSAR
jgi:outer membrane lipoprotein SlyB